MDEDVEFGSLLDLVGEPIKDVSPPHALTASVDTIRHFARAYGDDNPLYSDPAYARSSPWGRLVAPPLFPICTGVPAVDQGGLDLDRLPGRRHQTIVRDAWILVRPIPEGLCLRRDRFLFDVTFPQSEETACELTERTTYLADEAIYAVHDRVRRYGSAPGRPGRGAVPARAGYSPEDLARIDEAYAAETRRGSALCYADDVDPGSMIGSIVKGPLTVTDLINYRAGVGPGPLGGEALRLAYLNRRDRPDLYETDAYGIPDIVERRHWDQQYAERLGWPGATDYSHTRITWFSHLLTDWMGDGGWLSQITATTSLGPNYVGDTHRVTGAVTGVTRDEGCGAVSIALEGRNQRNEVTCRADAVVLLPRRPARRVSDKDIAAVGLARIDATPGPA